MRNPLRAGLAISFLPLLGPAALAQSLNLTGSWTVQMTAAVPVRGGPVPPSTTCDFTGTANVFQSGTELSGDLTVNRTSGALPCPHIMSGTLTGSVSGSAISMGVMVGGGMLGQATFTGTATTGGAAPNAAASGAARSAAVGSPSASPRSATAAPGAGKGASTPAAAQQAAATSASGTYVTTSGPFSGTSGTWSAAQIAPIATVPALGGRGLALLALLLLGTATWFLWKRTAPRRA